MAGSARRRRGTGNNVNRPELDADEVEALIRAVTAIAAANTENIVR